jgi:hypothetical protein
MFELAFTPKFRLQFPAYEFTTSALPLSSRVSAAYFDTFSLLIAIFSYPINTNRNMKSSSWVGGFARYSPMSPGLCKRAPLVARMMS